MKVFFSGSQGTGKSTLNKQFCEKYREFKSIDSVSELFAKDRDTFKDPSKLLKFQTEIALYCSGEYIKDYENLISSRGFADMYAYNRYSASRSNNRIYNLLMDTAQMLQIEFLKDSKVIYFPIMFDLEGKPLRSKDKDFQQEIDTYIREFFYSTSTQFYQIETLDNRLVEIESYIFKRES